ncbi:glycosyltransferase [Stagnimonas aquatica]|uniref:Glycosyltransferase n=1 Tax=Stagnimonas aquatica TaxID=2689987 RepID=A0A3N0VIQ4_9GAMM|nr:glycosyltransferase family 4 protein [Stagnimonas aquatica]ROH92098.1 glycosyltransferase [Stagnimonas aquatica]
METTEARGKIDSPPPATSREMSSSRPRIAFISSLGGIPWGGSEELWAATALELHRRGGPVLAASQALPQRPPRLQALAEAGVPLCAFEPSREAAVAQVFQALEALQPQLVVVSQGHYLVGFEWMELLRQRGWRYAPLVHVANDWRLAEPQMERVARVFDGAVASFFVSEANHRQAERMLARPIPRAEQVRNPYLVPWDGELPWPASASPRLACVARLQHPVKGHDVLLEALADPALRALAEPLGVEVSLFGEGAHHAYVEQLLGHYQLPWVRLRGQVSDISGIWRQHQLLVLPSRYEGLPLAIVEAMLSGRPVLCTDVGGNTEIVEDGVSGFVAAAANGRQLALTLRRALQERERWPAMGRAAAERARLRMPRDPAAGFADRLTELATGS